MVMTIYRGKWDNNLPLTNILDLEIFSQGFTIMDWGIIKLEVKPLLKFEADTILTFQWESVDFGTAVAVSASARAQVSTRCLGFAKVSLGVEVGTLCIPKPLAHLLGRALSHALCLRLPKFRD